VHKAVIPPAIGTCFNHSTFCAWDQHYPKIYFYYLFSVKI